jgi:hypothetical protein
MLNLRRRLRQLEAQLTDHTGLVPHTRPWLDYWLTKYERLARGQDEGEPRSIPLAAWRAIVAHTNSCETATGPPK